MDPARGVEASTVVTAMARNGTEFGIQVSGLEGEWFTAPAPRVNGLLLPGWKEEDAGLDMGDSAITETVGWGGFVIGGAPGILSFTGGTAEQALAFSRDMRSITVGRSPDYLMPALDFEGTAVGIDIRKVVQTNMVPVIDTAIAHREPGHGIIGGGIVRPPLECFTKALKRFAREIQGVTGGRVGQEDRRPEEPVLRLGLPHAGRARASLRSPASGTLPRCWPRRRTGTS